MGGRARLSAAAAALVALILQGRKELAADGWLRPGSSSRPRSCRGGRAAGQEGWGGPVQHVPTARAVGAAEGRAGGRRCGGITQGGRAGGRGGREGSRVPAAVSVRGAARQRRGPSDSSAPSPTPVGLPDAPHFLAGSSGFRSRTGVGGPGRALLGFT